MCSLSCLLVALIVGEVALGVYVWHETSALYGLLALIPGVVLVVAGVSELSSAACFCPNSSCISWGVRRRTS
jgi:hypothetical protein